MNRQSRRLLKSVRKRGNGRIDARARDTVDAMMRSAVARQVQGEHEAALSDYNDILELYPDHPDALSNSGFLIAHLGDAEGALPRLRKAVDLPPGDAKLRNNLGTVLETAGLLDEAESELRRAIEIDPTIAEAHVNLGNVLQKLEKPGHADEAYGQALAHAADNPETFINIAVALMGRQQYGPARDSLDAALAIDPDHADALFNRGSLRQYRGEFTEAIMDFRAAIAAKPVFANAYYGLGNAQEVTGDSEGAIAAYSDCLRANPAHANACLSLSRLLRDEGRINEVVPLLRKAAEEHAANPVVLSMLANLLGDGDDLDEAVAVGTRAHVIDGCSAPAICSLAKALVEKGLYEDAATLYETLTPPADAHDVVAHGWLAESLLRHQRFADGWSILDRMLLGEELTERQRYGYLIYKAIHCWLNDDAAGCDGYVDQAAAMVQRVGVHDMDKNPVAYAHYLKQLAANRRLKPELYRAAASDVLHIIGESHCLSPHGTVLEIGGALYRLESHMIVGCKAWHLADPKVNYFQRAYWTIAGGLPEGANLLVTIGEIDCRMDEGMFPRHKKTGTALDEIIESTVGGFVGFVAGPAAARGHRLNICGVPAPHPARSSRVAMADGDLRVYLEIIKNFNKKLEDAAKQHDFGFVDLYSLTVGEGAAADGAQHIDDTHLYPSAIHQALLSA